MAVDLHTDLCMRLDEPVTSSELRAAKTDREALQNTKNASIEGTAVKLVSDFSKNRSLMRRHKSKKKKKEKRRERQAREQAFRIRQAKKRVREKCNHDAIREKAVELQRKVSIAALRADEPDASVLSSEGDLDTFVHDTAISDVEEDHFDDIADSVT